MATRVNNINPSTYKDSCFLPTKERKKVGFLGDDEPGYKQVYELALKDDKVEKQKKDPSSIKKEVIDYYAERKKVIKDKKGEILDHVDMRIILFFEQAILCHKTPFVFSTQGAEDQIGLGTTLKKGKEIVHKTQAAHPSTLPCLHAHFRDDLDKSFIYLKHSSSYKRHSTTNELPIEVNQTDTLLDGKETENKLRKAALKILNKDAEGKIEPTEALKQFLETMQDQLEQHINSLRTEDIRRQVAEIYLERVKLVREEIKGKSEIFDRIMGLQLPDDEVLRTVVYKRRYKVLKEAACIESSIAKKIFDAEKEILGTRVNSLKNVATPLRYVLIEGAASVERVFFEKLFCTSLDQLNSHFERKDKQLRAARNEVEKLKKGHSQTIKKLREEVALLCRELEYLEVNFRAHLFKGLRKEYKDWTQPEFVKQFQKIYPSASMSQSMVSRIEYFTRHSEKEFYETPECQRKKELSFKETIRIAKTFEIDSALFFPGLLSSY